ncbi:protoporphyrinogen oxidase-like protein [Xylogone sp. PMI_703]|nr:protoporphyrinogen oxidase-like protein [Xylogone sp. PMI_703]
MRSKIPDDYLVSLLRRCYTAPSCFGGGQPTRNLSIKSSSALYTRRNLPGKRNISLGNENRYRAYQANHLGPKNIDLYRNTLDLSRDTNHPRPDNAIRRNNGNQPRIAVIGGGITGLAAAYYLTKEIPRAKITLYEQNQRLGGWLQTKSVEVQGGTVLLEQGPRTLRHASPAGMLTLRLVEELGLEDEMLITPKTAAAAQNRFIYYPDHLVKMPGPGQDLYQMLWTILREPVFKGIIPGALFEFRRPGRHVSSDHRDPDDESIASFLSRRLGSSAPVDNIISAVIHGIYAGDIYRLSAASLMPDQYAREGMYGSFTSAIGHYIRQGQTASVLSKDHTLLNEMLSKLGLDMKTRIQHASVYSFKKGISTLSKALESSIRANPNVTIELGQKIQRLIYSSKTSTILAGASQYDRVISTISASATSSILHSPITPLTQIPYVTVMVVNLYFSDPNILPEQGFGYLIPRSIPFEQNPECALGVVFDSESLRDQDTAPGTKVTVMLGGHWWDGFTSYPDSDEAVSMARAVLKRHLNIDEEPEAVNASLQRDCIPQYTVGHKARLIDAHYRLMSEFGGKLAVAGSSYTGVGLNDCIRAARDLAKEVAADDEGVTGLESFVQPQQWIMV